MDKTETNDLLEECMLYFKARPVYKKLFLKMRDKYAGLGHFGGTAMLTSLSREEKSQLGGFFQRDYTSNKTITISADLMKKCLESSKFAGLTWELILETYFGEPLQVKKEIELAESKRREDYFAEILESISDESGREWLRSILEEKKEGYLLITQLYKESPEELRSILTYVTTGIAKLKVFQDKKQKELLAVFSANVTGNPHYFDHGTTAGQLLVHGMCYGNEMTYPKNAHQWREVLLSYGIVPDNLSSIVHVYGLRIQIKGNWHPAYDAFCQMQEPYAVTMENLQELTAVQPEGDRVYIVENEMVFSYLLKHLKNTNITLLCTSGQLRSAAVKLISFLVDSGAEIYYSGDIDPDGIRIADRLWKKYGDRIHIWRMSKCDYEKSISEELLGTISLKKLEAVEHPILAKTAESVKKRKKAGYQENILDDFLADLIK